MMTSFDWLNEERCSTLRACRKNEDSVPSLWFLCVSVVDLVGTRVHHGETEVGYRWNVDEARFAMPVRVGSKEGWQTIQPTTEWQTMKTPLTKDQFMVATDLYYIDVSKL
jgi:hypothetical protein